MARQEMDYFTALYNVASVINASLEPSKVLEEIVRSVAEAIKVKACLLRLLDERRKKLLLGAYYGLSDHYIQKGPLLVEESGLDQEALKGEIIWIKDAQTDPRFRYQDMARAEGIKSVLVVPLKAGSRVIGVLRVYADRIRKFRKKEVRFMEAVANLSAIALDNARMHQRVQTEFDLLAGHKYRLDDN
jgi:signal transduction protein with GAF and PtsI domain